MALKYDGDACLFKVGCRYYDPQLGAFTSRDTELEQKPYLYCEHDPVNAVDPSGHYDWWALINDIQVSVFGAIGGVIALPTAVETAGRGPILGVAIGAGVGHLATDGEKWLVG